MSTAAGSFDRQAHDGSGLDGLRLLWHELTRESLAGGLYLGALMGSGLLAGLYVGFMWIAPGLTRLF